ncbi:hypothetical protein FEM48_Zijuj09G0124400 [Ziziphus jujuba var. spinosa]|uniref:Uncharacterized protein n=1 Tax=Ziziphus jujuba var. spinosa TaxID=714518 RepID=A0A978UT01_ZIZJJ|nr:hypothetical protein FEM48_Zijuj09G0124400 [Ziziphus jujuba var. spinosa]
MGEDSYSSHNNAVKCYHDLINLNILTRGHDECLDSKNRVNASCKRNDKLQAAQAIKVAKMIAIDKLKAGKGANQIGNLQRAVILDGVLISVRFFKMLYVKDKILFN